MMNFLSNTSRRIYNHRQRNSLSLWKYSPPVFLCHLLACQHPDWCSWMDFCSSSSIPCYLAKNNECPGQHGRSRKGRNKLSFCQQSVHLIEPLSFQSMYYTFRSRTSLQASSEHLILPFLWQQAPSSWFQLAFFCCAQPKLTSFRLHL